MPYTAYQALSDADIGALYAYFMNGVRPVDARPPETRLPFPFNVRSSMIFWNAMFLADHRLLVNPARSIAWNRGAYLVGPLAHCSACHTPRNTLMAEKPSRAFAGGSLGTWYAPNITSDPNSGIGAWKRSELLQYLKSGKTAHAQAGGGMAEAVSNSLQFLTADDLEAIATYVQSLPPIAEPAQALPRAASGRPAHYEGALRAAPFSNTADGSPSGEELYSGNCAACHGVIGGGSSDGNFPALYRNTATGAIRSDNLIAAILTGVDRTAGGKRSFMPSFGTSSNVQRLSDAQIAALGTYILSSMGDAQARVSTDDVATRRAGGPTAPLVIAAKFGIPLAAIMIAALISFLVMRRSRGRHSMP